MPHLSLNNKIDFLNQDFNCPKDFEKNFEYYFAFRENDKEKILKEKFKIYDDQNESRAFLALEFINNSNFGNRLNYFGGSGKGKSITLIGALKYYNNFKIHGSFYINCKALKDLLDKEKYNIVKRILIDEIAYLFYDKYNDYFSCYEKIVSNNFLDDSSFWPLIDFILEKCSKYKKKFIIGFDQYNFSIDPKDNLKTLEDKYLAKKRRFKFIVISSMNETDIREQKIKLLFKQTFGKIIEIQTVCEDFQTNFIKDQLYAFKSLGKTFKAYNEISVISNNKNGLETYLNEKKKKYLFKK